jgi:hypothetical protein
MPNKPIIDSLADVETFLTLIDGGIDLPQMEKRGVSVNACAEIAHFASMIYVARCIEEAVFPTHENTLGFVASFSMMIGIELQRRGVLNEDE